MGRVPTPLESKELKSFQAVAIQLYRIKLKLVPMIAAAATGEMLRW